MSKTENIHYRIREFYKNIIRKFLQKLSKNLLLSSKSRAKLVNEVPIWVLTCLSNHIVNCWLVVSAKLNGYRYGRREFAVNITGQTSSCYYLRGRGENLF